MKSSRAEKWQKMTNNVSIRSLIDHIKTAIDVDPWAKEMAEELLKRQEAIAPGITQDVDGIFATCVDCKKKLCKMMGSEFVVNPDEMPRFCSHCGQAVKWE